MIPSLLLTAWFINQSNPNFAEKAYTSLLVSLCNFSITFTASICGSVWVLSRSLTSPLKPPSGAWIANKQSAKSSIAVRYFSKFFSIIASIFQAIGPGPTLHSLAAPFSEVSLLDIAVTSPFTSRPFFNPYFSCPKGALKTFTIPQNPLTSAFSISSSGENLLYLCSI